jgi:hypothetical protein
MHAAEESIYEFPLYLEILISAAALVALLALTRRKDLGYWSWCWYSKRRLDKLAYCLLMIGQAVTVGVIAALVPVIHEVVGIRPISDVGAAFLVVEAVIAGWAAIALVQSKAPNESDGGDSLRELLITVMRAAGQALNERARLCVRPTIERRMDLDEETRSKILSSFRDSVSTTDRPAADLIAENLTEAWSQGQNEREKAMDALAGYVRERRVAPYSLLGKR